MNNNDSIERRKLRFLQSPYCSTNCLLCICLSDQGTVVWKSCVTHWALVTYNMLCATLYEGTAQLLSLFLFAEANNWWISVCLELCLFFLSFFMLLPVRLSVCLCLSVPLPPPPLPPHLFSLSLHSKENKHKWVKVSASSMWWCVSNSCQIILVNQKSVFLWLPCQTPVIMGSVLRLVGPLSVYCQCIAIWDCKFDLQLLSQCGCMLNCLGISVTEITLSQLSCCLSVAACWIVLAYLSLR